MSKDKGVLTYLARLSVYGGATATGVALLAAFTFLQKDTPWWFVGLFLGGLALLSLGLVFTVLRMLTERWRLC